ncbi:MAG: zinc-ribbon domain containing protein [Candidatus Moranbacteria bacterium]|nr:zinc-ribbon domain containing protein [Candidatus Moranbacteria bacterium]
MIKECKKCGVDFEITDEDQVFYKKMDVIAPSLCPDCRNNLRISFRNFYRLYVRKSDMSGETIISMYPEKTPYTVYSSEEWHGDKWDPMEYGTEIDFGRPFFEQWRELQIKVPRAALLHHQSENSSYCNLAFKSKSCYMIFGAVENEDCYYGHIVWFCKDCVDCLYPFECELCYECIDCVGCYNCNYSQECRNSNDLNFCYDCVGCHNCFGCAGLRQKEYYWGNEKITKEEYSKRAKKYDEGVRLLEKMRENLIYPEYYGYQNEDVSGNHVYYSKNTHHSFDAKRCEDCKFLFTANNMKDSYDLSFSPDDCELCYNCLTVGNSQRLLCCQWSHDSYGLKYCENCNSCQDCFGCIGLKHKKNCVFNKQYSKEEYEKLSGKLVEGMKTAGEYGEFFPVGISPFKFEETAAYMYNPKGWK